MSALWRAMLFASVPLILGILADLLYQDEGWRREILMIHGIFFSAVFVLCGAGAFLPFFFGRSRTPSRKVILFAAVLFASASFYAVDLAFDLGVAFGLNGLIALGAWLFFGAALFAAGAFVFSERNKPTN